MIKSNLQGHLNWFEQQHQQNPNTFLNASLKPEQIQAPPVQWQQTKSWPAIKTGPMAIQKLVQADKVNECSFLFVLTESLLLQRYLYYYLDTYLHTICNIQALKTIKRWPRPRQKQELKRYELLFYLSFYF